MMAAGIEAQPLIKPPTALRVIMPTGVARTNAVLTHASRLHAVAVAVAGHCSFSHDGVTFSNFDGGQIFEAGAIIRTGEKARADLLFQRSGTTVRLQAGTEIMIDRMAVKVKENHPAEDVLLALRAGRIFTVMRPAATDRRLEISNAAFRAVMEGRAGGRYIIAADGTCVAAIGSIVPLKLISDNGLTMIAAGQQFARQDGHLCSLAKNPYHSDLDPLDELQASIHGPAAGRP